MPSMATNSLLIQPGNLRHAIRIQKPSSTRDAAGQPIDTWTLVLATRASIENTGSIAYKESFSMNSLASEATDLVTMRWPGASIAVSPGMRVLYGDNKYLVQAVDNVMRRNIVVRLACLLIDGDSN